MGLEGETRRVLPWLLAGTAIGAGVAILVMKDSWDMEYEYDTGSDGVERAARKTYGWGAKQRAEGKVGSFVGRVKEGVGRFTGDSEMAGEGAVEKVAGEVKDKVGEFGTAAAQTIHDLNK